ncbi:hypothetical protein EBZ39_09410 [bacterium]|nr:hypothetical protein [bacterium]
MGAVENLIGVFASQGGILGLVILTLLGVIVGSAYMVWVFIARMFEAHESRLSSQDQRHLKEREEQNNRWAHIVEKLGQDIRDGIAEVVREVRDTQTEIRVIGKKHIEQRRKAA